MAKSTTAIVLAAGLGTRMKSEIPKVLHAAAGRPMISYVISALKAAAVEKVRIVIGHGAAAVKTALDSEKDCAYYIQKNQLGTANAVGSAEINSLSGRVLICNGDHPLITDRDYASALSEFDKSACDLLVVSSKVSNPAGFGRIVRKGPTSLQIVEDRDASDEEKIIDEVNSGLYVLKAEMLKKYLPLIENKNLKKEFYLTDLVKLALAGGSKVEVYCSPRARVCRGVNTQGELAQAARVLYRRKSKALEEQGVIFVDPSNTYIDADVSVGEGTTIGPGCSLTGSTAIGKMCVIEGHCQIVSSNVKDAVTLRWGSVLENCEVHAKASVGPYARLREGTVIGTEAHVGNFVEMKKTFFGSGSKAGHLTYLGDSEIGENTNIGCGTITCNYAVDKKKYKTKIGNNVFVGSDTQFVAPVTIGDNSVIASGSTITESVPDDGFAIARSRQTTKSNYKKKD